MNDSDFETIFGIFAPVLAMQMKPLGLNLSSYQLIK